MAFLGKPTLELGKPDSSRNVKTKITVPLIVERLELCLMRSCAGAERDPVFQVKAEIWSDDTNEPAFTQPISRAVLHFWRWTDPGTEFKTIRPADLANAQLVGPTDNRAVITLRDERSLLESTLNEDFGSSASELTRDEVFLRVYLSSIFTAWQFNVTADSDIVKGQFFGP